MKNLFIPVILCTGRIGRESEKVANFIFKELSKVEGVETELIDIKDYLISPFTIPSWEEGTEGTKKWRELVIRASSLLLVVPEYNHGYPGELKLLLDSAYDEYKNKPIGLVGVSKGVFGGTRMIDHIRSILATLKAISIPDYLLMPQTPTLFDDAGNMIDEKHKERSGTFLATVVDFTRSYGN